MDKDTDSFKLDKIYQYLWAAHDEAPFTLLDRSLNPRSSTVFMLDFIRQVGVNEDSSLLDIGCGRGNHTIALADRFGCNITGIDLLASNLELARKATVAVRLTSRVNFRQGSIESIPADDETFDYIWCRDMLIHVAELKQGLKECSRVLRPGGTMLIYTTFRTEWLEMKEMARVCDPLGIIMRNLSPDYFEQAMSDAGFEILIREMMGGEQIEFLEERDRRYSKELIRIARMIRQRERFVREMGEECYQTALALYHWGIYQLLGKLSSTVYVLKK
ncbi:MAG: methyltransferase domain-containing protein [Acidobacteria bacterium]|nr:methyltransferase domain-containing protein [Acidobacteriota bacterium]MCI0665565.1 methyltransferase domain-containing protein [Acidobacteriota bacterium]